MNTSADNKNRMVRIFFRALVLLASFMAVVYSSSVQGQVTDQKNPGMPMDLPIHIESDTMEARQEDATVEFSGNVVAAQEDLEIRADSIKIFFQNARSQPKPAPKDTGFQIEKIVSTGHVHCVTGQRQAFADKAVYTSSDQILVMTGSKVKLMEGANEVTGEKLTLFIPQNRAVMESNTRGRVRASFTPARATLPVPPSDS